MHHMSISGGLHLQCCKFIFPQGLRKQFLLPARVALTEYCFRTVSARECASIFLPAREARIAFGTLNMQGDRLVSMVDGPTKRAMLTADMDRGRLIHVPAEWPAQNTPDAVASVIGLSEHTCLLCPVLVVSRPVYRPLHQIVPSQSVCTFNRDFILDIYVCWLYCCYLGDLGAAEEPRWDVLAACTIEDSMDEESMAYFVTLLKAPQHCYCPEPSDGNSIEYR